MNGDAKKPAVFEVGGKMVTMDPTVITVDEWGDLMMAIMANDKESGNKILVRLALKMLGDQAKGISILYLGVIFAKTSEVLQAFLSEGDVEDEVTEILNKKAQKDT